MSLHELRRRLVERGSLEPELIAGPSFERAAAERAGSGGFDHYISVIDRDPDEFDRLVSEVAVPESWFFRYGESFEELRRRLIALPKPGPLRMASVACAGGEEPYSMAMTALASGWGADGDRRCEILALDRSPVAIAKAAQARYGPASLRAGAPGWASSFLQREGAIAGVAAPVREMVRFQRADLTTFGALGGGPFDIIFCRNVLMYLHPAARARMTEAVFDALGPGGVLFTGHAELQLWNGLPLRAAAVPHAFMLERAQPGHALASSPRTQWGAAPIAFVPRDQTSASPRAPLPRIGTPDAAQPDVKDQVRTLSQLQHARDLADSGRLAEAQAVLGAAVTESAPTAEGLELLGVLRVSAGDDAGAGTAFQRALYLDPTRVVCLMQLAMMCERSGDARAAEAYWARARRAESRDCSGGQP